MNILSLFDGMSVAQEALKELGIEVENYFASEIDKYAIATTQANFPNTVQLGDVKDIENIWKKFGMKPNIDLLIGGSPCQDLSIAKQNREGLSGKRSGLFYEYLRIRDEIRPKYFVLENVNSMPKEAREEISECLGVEPIMINASLVSAQNRKRLFWIGKLNEKTSKYEQVEIELPEDKGILLKDILEENVDEKYFLNDSNIKNLNRDSYGAKGSISKLNEKTKTLTSSMGSGGGNGIYTTVRIGSLNSGGQGDRIYSPNGKSVNLSANGGGRGAKTGLYQQENKIRKLTPTECLRLQLMPDNYFDKAICNNKPISNTQRYKMCGNAFNCEVIKHILKNIL
ncbi:DNA (cytosine-5-)-methyltransferase [bacterium]|nr:DNA (cytosine-5-)-methyltransferase [bacterium]